jgi:acyl-CoA thioester hydrolase
MDNDVYGHVNNVVYYAYFDSIVNRYLINAAELDIHSGDTIGLMVNSHCNYFSSVSFPDKLVGGLLVSRIGNSSVDYQVAIFKQDEHQACAAGQMTHVFVNRHDKRPTPVKGALLRALKKVQRSENT